MVSSSSSALAVDWWSSVNDDDVQNQSICVVESELGGWAAEARKGPTEMKVAEFLLHSLSAGMAAVCGRIKNRPTLKTHRPSEGSRYFSEHRLREQRNFLNSPDRIFGNQSRLSRAA